MEIQAVLTILYWLVCGTDYVYSSCLLLKYVHSGRCCDQCPPGKFVQNHCNETTQTVCETCMVGTFSSDWNSREECSPCNDHNCKPTMGLVQICNSTVNNQCGCVNLDQFHDRATDSCRDCKRCRPGTYPEKPCTDETICSPCQKGYFSNKTDNCYEQCVRCRDCVLYEKQCSSTNDAVCSRDFFPTTPQRQTFEESTPNLKTEEKHIHEDSTKPSKFEPILIVIIVTLIALTLIVCLILLYCKRKQETCPYRAGYGFNIITESRGRTTSFGGLLLREQPARIILGLHALLNPKTQNNWRAVAAELGVSYLSILNFEANIETSCKEMLHSWGTSNDATVDKLYEALRKNGRDDACRFLEENVEFESEETTV
ncbi:tumor necrosis factor receptor superfamily member 16-like [Dendronephthya gigantea]|uniref:tumor necrosis factor receptor superfamily member 16-like n=1 Tax=Dendronephthya gigantea TaxID=151771 RepID=UPI0010698F4A|nr:tumor necrosis factor receptor superfamily member 16-like [Dendronephthya gigantea]